MIYNQQKLLSKKFPMTNSFLSDERKVTKLIEECPDLDSERGLRRGMVSLGGGTMYNKIRNPNTKVQSEYTIEGLSNFFI